MPATLTPEAGIASYANSAWPCSPNAQRPTSDQLASTSAASGNSVLSPMSTSSTSRSYASGLESVKASP